jgi:hypothetical protein
VQLPWERRIPKKEDVAGWDELRVFAAGLIPPRKSRKPEKPKPKSSIFQVPNRKRKKPNQALEPTTLAHL